MIAGPLADRFGFRAQDASRTLALLYDRAANAGRIDAPASTRVWIEAIDGAAALVSPDTGAAHLGGMIGVPVVDVFPDADFDAQTRRWRPWASSSLVVRASELSRAPETVIAQALDGL